MIFPLKPPLTEDFPAAMFDYLRVAGEEENSAEIPEYNHVLSVLLHIFIRGKIRHEG